MGQTTIPGRPQLRPWQPGQSGVVLSRSRGAGPAHHGQRHRAGAPPARHRAGDAIPLAGRNGTQSLQPQRPNLNQRMQAVELLLERGWGRAKEVIELLGDATPEQQQSMRRALLESLTDDERTQLQALLQRALARTMAPAPPEAPPEAEPTEGAAARDTPEGA